MTPLAHASSPQRLSIPAVHQSAAAPWLARLATDDVLALAAVPACRWLRVERGCLWVTAAVGAPGPVPREADIWLSEGDSLLLPPGTSWLLQAWPGADLMLVEQAPLRRLAPGGALFSGLSGLRAWLLARAHRIGLPDRSAACTA